MEKENKCDHHQQKEDSILKRAQTPSHTNKTVGKKLQAPYLSIEVCQGPDCTGLGGGAAILEIEELVQNYQKDAAANHRLETYGSIELSSGGCRDFCTVGPNVHLLRPTTRNKSIILESFHSVKDVSKCKEVVQSVKEECDTRVHTHTMTMSLSSKTSNNTAMCQSMMIRRADRIRWESLREISRIIAKCRKEQRVRVEKEDATNCKKISLSMEEERVEKRRNMYIKECTKHLDSISRAESAALRMVKVDPVTSEEETQRRIRHDSTLLEVITKRLTDCFHNREAEELSSDDEL